MFSESGLRRLRCRRRRESIDIDSTSLLLHSTPAHECGHKDHEKVARYLISLITDRSWIDRRIETVKLLDEGRYERRVTLDISQTELRRRANEIGIAQSNILPVPFAFLEKTLLLDIDLCDGDQQRLPVLTSDQDSFAAQLLLMALFEDEMGRAAERDEAEMLYKLCRGFYHDTQDSASKLDILMDGLPPERSNLIRYAHYFRQHYPVMTYVPVNSDGTYLLKYRLVESTYTRHKRTVAEALCVDATNYAVETVLDVPRQHLRVLAPPGTFFVTAHLYRDGSTGSPVGYLSRVTPDRAIAYVGEVDAVSGSGHIFGLSLRPRAAGAFTATLIFSLISVLVLTSGLVGEFLGRLLTERNTSGLEADPTVALILAVPSIGVAYILRGDEHALSGYIVSWLRTLLLSSAALTFVAALSIALNGWPWTVRVAWLVALFANLVSIIVNFAAWISSRRALRDTEAASGETLSLSVESLP